MSSWGADFPSPLDFLDLLLSGDAFVPQTEGTRMCPSSRPPARRPRARRRGRPGHRPNTSGEALATGRPGGGKPGAVGASRQRPRPRPRLTPSRELPAPLPVGGSARPTLGEIGGRDAPQSAMEASMSRSPTRGCDIARGRSGFPTRSVGGLAPPRHRQHTIGALVRCSGVRARGPGGVAVKRVRCGGDSSACRICRARSGSSRGRHRSRRPSS